MQINTDSVVTFHYRLSLDSGQAVDSSEGSEPLTYTHGSGQIIPGLEQALAAKQVGDKFEVDIAATDAYGERDEELMVQIPRTAFPDEAQEQLQPGVRFQGPHPADPEKPAVLTVLKVDDEAVIADANHPLAGQNLHFDVDVVAVQNSDQADSDQAAADE